MTGKVKGCVHYGLWLYNNVNLNLIQQLIHICSAMIYHAKNRTDQHVCWLSLHTNSLNVAPSL